jgi:hypothetical protein
MSDHCIDPQSEILRNKFGLINQESLNRAEANAVSARSSPLQLNPLRGVGHGQPNMLHIQSSTSTCVPISWLLLPVNSTFRERRCYPWTETLVCVALEAGI